MMSKAVKEEAGMYKMSAIIDAIPIHRITETRGAFRVIIGKNKKVENERKIIPTPMTILAAVTVKPLSVVNQPVQKGRKIPHVIKKKKNPNDNQRWLFKSVTLS